MTETTLDTYDMKNDAIGLADFIHNGVQNFIPPNETPIIYVYAHGLIVTKARLLQETLSDGSLIFNLYLEN